MAPCLKDFNEDVRFAAIEALGKQNNSEAQPLLLDALRNPDEESNRLRYRIAQFFQEHGWDLADKASDVEAILPSGWTIVDNKLESMA